MHFFFCSIAIFKATSNLLINIDFLTCNATFLKFNASYVCSFVNIKSRFQFIY